MLIYTHSSLARTACGMKPSGTFPSLIATLSPAKTHTPWQAEAHLLYSWHDEPRFTWLTCAQKLSSGAHLQKTCLTLQVSSGGLWNFRAAQKRFAPPSLSHRFAEQPQSAWMDFSKEKSALGAAELEGDSRG